MPPRDRSRHVRTGRVHYFPKAPESAYLRPAACSRRSGHRPPGRAVMIPGSPAPRRSAPGPFRGTRERAEASFRRRSNVTGTLKASGNAQRLGAGCGGAARECATVCPSSPCRAPVRSRGRGLRRWQDRRRHKRSTVASSSGIKGGGALRRSTGPLPTGNPGPIITRTCRRLGASNQTKT